MAGPYLNSSPLTKGQDVPLLASLVTIHKVQSPLTFAPILLPFIFFFPLITYINLIYSLYFFLLHCHLMLEC